ncbi:hypothetical protein GYMLUDRAFT_266168 [Collybiopsis luxurians FD-317 M1]|uniref:AMP-dependent synthetase/ligase domain-containing protein n=1 Tax=Collybiopsis luxurians FD-317 M1 TaxID=944289 RepID=A0A0D0B8H6_9AGAR|nr:hypothetical protein GYMLUDRAFT_266168 [Collybiopsis luxurians FD-317 M1]
MPAPFTPPPFLALEYQLDYHFTHNPSYPVVLHPSTDGTHVVYTYSDLVPRVHKVAHYIRDQMENSGHCSASPPIIAILCQMDSFTTFLLIMGILRAGMTVFPISPRFSLTVVAHLIDSVKPSQILVNGNSYPFVLEALKLLKDKHVPGLLQAPASDFLFSECNGRADFPQHTRDINDTAFIVHSSSSSALFPKTINRSAYFMLKDAEIIDYAYELVVGKIFGLQGLELFHTSGLMFLSWMPRSGFIMAMLNPKDKSSVSPPSPNTIYNGFVQTKPSFAWVSPALIETWAFDSEERTIDLLKPMNGVITGGRRLNAGVGVALAKKGVRINTLYGSTENGIVGIISENTGDDWEYFCAPPIPELKFTSRPDGLYTLKVLSTENRDIFMKHPIKENHYIVVGRIGDQIMLSSGQMASSSNLSVFLKITPSAKQVNPVPIEEMLCRILKLESALLFGQSRKHLGVLVQPCETAGLNVEQVRTAIQHINPKLSLHSRISEQLILLAQPTKPILQSPKGMPRRALALKDYENEIHCLYLEKYPVA